MSAVLGREMEWEKGVVGGRGANMGASIRFPCPPATDTPRCLLEQCGRVCEPITALPTHSLPYEARASLSAPRKP